MYKQANNFKKPYAHYVCMAKLIKGRTMETFFYIIIFIIGSLFGSFYTLAVYRIPKRQDITHTHSYCPNCNHKLGLLDLFPIFSYIFLRGRCRYCKEKIRPRYLILEILSGTLFLVIAYFMGLNLENLSFSKIANYCFIVLYLTFIILIAGIDKENRKIDKYVNVYGVAISILYMVYLCIVENANIYRYGIYLILYILILTFDTITLKKFAKSTYTDGVLLMLVTMAIFTGEFITITTIITTLVAIALYIIICKIINEISRKKTDEKVSSGISIGFCLVASNLILFIVSLIYNYYYL